MNTICYFYRKLNVKNAKHHKTIFPWDHWYKPTHTVSILSRVETIGFGLKHDSDSLIILWFTWAHKKGKHVGNTSVKYGYDLERIIRKQWWSNKKKKKRGQKSKTENWKRTWKISLFIVALIVKYPIYGQNTIGDYPMGIWCYSAVHGLYTDYVYCSAFAFWH